MELKAFYNHNEKEVSYYLVATQRNGKQKKTATKQEGKVHGK